MSWNDIPQHQRDRATRILTPRQLAILQDRLNGHTWRTIANAYRIDEATARGHYRRALDRLRRKDTPA